MKPVEFPEVNLRLGENQPEFETLPVHLNMNKLSQPCIYCFKLTFRERLKLLFTGKLWFEQLTFNSRFQPVGPSVNKSDMDIIKETPSHL